MIIQSKMIVDSTKVSNDLSFEFANLSTDTFNISFSPRSYPYDVTYIVCLKDSEDIKVAVDYSSTCPYAKNMEGICPTCKKKDEVIPIRYGLLAGKIGKGKREYYPGGCIESDCQPSWFCQRDKKSF